MKETGVAERYARALFLSLKASDETSFESVRKGLAQAHQKISSDSALSAALRNPLFPIDRKKSVLTKSAALGSVPAVLANFLGLLLEKKRMDLLPLILARFERSVEESEGVLKASVKSAFPLSESEKKEIEKKLSTIFQRRVKIESSVHPELLAGVVVKAGDTVIDTSFRNKLKNLKASLTL